jgi:hypothetical protein
LPEEETWVICQKDCGDETTERKVTWKSAEWAVATFIVATFENEIPIKIIRTP